MSPYCLKIKTIAIINGNDIIVPTIATWIIFVYVAFVITLVIPAILGHTINNAKATDTMSNGYILPP